MENKKVKLVKFNWRQVGSTIDRDGAGEDWERFTVGTGGVVEIKEHMAQGEGDKWHYYIIKEDGSDARIFNPNYVEYFP